MTAKPDAKDLKILQMLDLNARMPFSQIGKSVGLPESVVRYRVEKMQREGLIKGFLAFIDTRRIGYRFHNIYLKLKVMTEEKEAELVQKIKEMKSVAWLVSTSGHYNLVVSILAKDNHHVETIYNDLMRVLEHNVVDDSVFMTTDAYQMPYLLSEDVADTQVSIGKDKLDVELNDFDLNILYELALNCRVTNLELASKFGVGMDTISEHIDKLMRSGIVKGFKPLIDMKMLGKEWFILLFKLKYVPEEEKKKFISSLKMMKETFFIVSGVGNYGMQVEFFCDNRSHFREVLNKIFPSESSDIIKEYTELKVIKEHKCFFYPVEANEEIKKVNIGSKTRMKMKKRRGEGKKELIEEVY